MAKMNIMEAQDRAYSKIEETPITFGGFTAVEINDEETKTLANSAFSWKAYETNLDFVGIATPKEKGKPLAAAFRFKPAFNVRDNKQDGTVWYMPLEPVATDDGKQHFKASYGFMACTPWDSINPLAANVFNATHVKVCVDYTTWTNDGENYVSTDIVFRAGTLSFKKAFDKMTFEAMPGMSEKTARKNQALAERYMLDMYTAFRAIVTGTPTTAPIEKAPMAKTDEAGNPLQDEKGNYVWETDGTKVRTLLDGFNPQGAFNEALLRKVILSRANSLGAIIANVGGLSKKDMRVDRSFIELVTKLAVRTTRTIKAGTMYGAHTTVDAHKSDFTIADKLTKTSFYNAVMLFFSIRLGRGKFNEVEDGKLAVQAVDKEAEKGAETYKKACKRVSNAISAMNKESAPKQATASKTSTPKTGNTSKQATASKSGKQTAKSTGKTAKAGKTNTGKKAAKSTGKKAAKTA